MKIAILGLFVLFYASCQPVQGVLSSSLMDASYEITDGSLFCSGDSDFYESKVLFVVDQTHSNKKSDPQKTMRRQGVQSFIEQNKNNNVSYGIIGFSNEVFSPMTLNGNEVSNDILAFTSDLDLFEESLTKTFSRKDKGRGNYTNLLHNVLGEIAEGIDFDKRVSGSKFTEYHIIFISDGNLSVREDGHKAFVNGVKGIVHQFDHVNVHSVYYGDYKNRGTGVARRVGRGIKAVFQLYAFRSIGLLPPISYNPSPSPASEEDTDDVRQLMQVSKTGQGHYVDQNEDSRWALDLNQQWSSTPFIVYNLNAGFCLNGKIGLDSDMDGLCDKDEERMAGFEPDNRFSFNDGYGDYFHWMEFEQQRISLTPCSNREDADRDFLTHCEEEYINSLPGDYPQLSTNNPDSDGDRILDGIEVLVYWANDPLAARNPYNLDKSSEGLSDYEKIARHISPFVPAEEQTSYDTSLVPVKGEKGSCYSVKQSKLPVYPTLLVNKDDTLSQVSQNQGENTLLIYTLRQRKDSLSRIYQFMYKSIYVDSGKLNLPTQGRSFQYLTFADSPGN